MSRQKLHMHQYCVTYQVGEEASVFLKKEYTHSPFRLSSVFTFLDLSIKHPIGSRILLFLTLSIGRPPSANITQIAFLFVLQVPRLLIITMLEKEIASSRRRKKKRVCQSTYSLFFLDSVFTFLDLSIGRPCR
jgi:hypothetical protein